MSNLRVIIADDEQPQHDALKEALQKRFKYVTFKSFYAVSPLIQFLQKHNDEYDILFLDNLFKAGLSGKNALPKIRQYAPELPIIFLTGNENYDYFAGVENYNIKFLNKPASEAEIFFAVRGSIKTRESFSEMQLKIASFQEELTKTRKWACDVLKLKDINVDINDTDLIDDKNWSLYQSKVLSIVEKMKEEELQKSGKQQFDTIKEKLIKKYSKFEESDINFYATGEFLWQNYKEQLIDFSPILISYSKFLEGVLRKLLVRHRIISQTQDSMLGGLIRELMNHPFAFGVNNEEKVRKLTKKLNTFTGYRNKAAHPEGVSSSMLEIAQDILFTVYNGEKMSALDFIHLNY